MTAMIACGACGQRFPVGAPHPCFDKAQEAVRENDLEEGPPDPVRHGNVGVIRMAASRSGIPRHPLAYYRHTPPGRFEQHMCLCQVCADRMKAEQVLVHIVDIEGEQATNLAALATAEDDAPCWRTDVDGCDFCGEPPKGQERVRTGPSEWFQILYLDDDTEWPP